MSKVKLFQQTPINTKNIRSIKGSFGWIDANFKLFLEKTSQEAKLIYYTLCLYSDRNGMCSLAQREIMESTQLGFRRIINGRDELIEKKLIACEHQHHKTKFQILDIPVDKFEIIKTQQISRGRSVVLDFYKKLGRKEPIKRIEKGVEIYNELINEGYSSELIEKTVDWVIKNISNAHSFGIVREVIGEVGKKEKKKEDFEINRKESFNKHKEEARINKESRVLDKSLEQIFNSLENEGKKKIEQRVRFEVDKLKVKPEFEGPILRSTRLKILRDEFLNK